MIDSDFTLLVYHQLICHADSDEAQARLSAEQEVFKEAMPWLNPERNPHWSISVPKEETPPYTPVTPRDNRPQDTDKTLYRWNHVTDADWNEWGYTGRRNWITAMIKKYGKAVVA